MRDGVEGFFSATPAEAILSYFVSFHWKSLVS